MALWYFGRDDVWSKCRACISFTIDCALSSLQIGKNNERIAFKNDEIDENSLTQGQRNQLTKKSSKIDAL
jgi:hypothetical protein